MKVPKKMSKISKSNLKMNRIDLSPISLLLITLCGLLVGCGDSNIINPERVASIEIGPRHQGWDGQLLDKVLVLRKEDEVQKVCELFNRKTNKVVNHPVGVWYAKLVFHFIDGTSDAYFVSKTKNQGAILGKIPKGIELVINYGCEDLGTYLETLASQTQPTQTQRPR